MINPLVGILMGSDSDLPVMEKAAQVLKELGVPYEMDISSAHRLPDKTAEYAKTARKRGLEVLIASTGMAAHLTGVIASYTTLPVIGVPLKSGVLNGVDALYSTVQMSAGIPVATVAIDGAKNAAYLFFSDFGDFSDFVQEFHEFLPEMSVRFLGSPFFCGFLSAGVYKI